MTFYQNTALYEFLNHTLLLEERKPCGIKLFSAIKQVVISFLYDFKILNATFGKNEIFSDFMYKI